MPEDTYTKIIIEKVEKNTGFSLQQHGVSKHQWIRISKLSDVLRSALVIEQMLKVEAREVRPSKMKSGRHSALKDSLETLEMVKSGIWEKCDSIAASILYDSIRNSEAQAPSQSSGKVALSCPSCNGNITILSYDEYKCQKCGLGYSAKDYLNILY